MTVSRQWTLASRPKGAPRKSDFEWRETKLPAPADGEVLARTLFMSLDPYMRGRMSEGPSYAKPVPVGGVMEGETVAEIVESRSGSYRPGDIVSGPGGWQSHWVRPAAELRPLERGPFPLSYHLGLLGMPGLTAYTGLIRIGQPKPGETVVVAAASGAVGSVVGQIAKRLGCRAVGIAGGPEKCAFVTGELGFDACIDHYDAAMPTLLREACSKGIDVYFENVGGPVWEAVLPRLNDFARVPVCGLIASYNARSREDLASETMMAELMRDVLVKRLHVEGFIVTDTWGEMMPAFQRDMAKWQAEKPFAYREDVTEGLEHAPEAFMAMLSGGNFGKAVVKVAE
jgi:NADPH-dependent curcumin reductase CurA